MAIKHAGSRPAFHPCWHRATPLGRRCGSV